MTTTHPASAGLGFEQTAPDGFRLLNGDEMNQEIEKKYAVEKSDIVADGGFQPDCAEPQEQAFDRLRADILVIEKRVRALVPQVGGRNPGEVKANLTLSFRHLEDARLRLGKAIQYSGNGVSCYDR